MYAIVEYEDYRKEQKFKVISTTDDIDRAIKIAFQNAKKKIPNQIDESIYKITTKIENEYLQPMNKTIISYRIINVKEFKKKFKISCQYSTVYAVIELEKDSMENIEEIDTSFICDNYCDDYNDNCDY